MEDSSDPTVKGGTEASTHCQTILHVLEHNLPECETYTDLAKFCDFATQALGSDNYVYHNYLPVPDETNSLHNMDSSWLGVYRKKDYLLIDPRTLYATVNSEPVYWSDFIYANDTTGIQQKSMIDEAATFGMGDGITIPVHDIGSEIAVFSLSAASGQLPHYSQLEQSLLSLFALKVHHCFKRIRACDYPPAPQRTQLSKREKECMQWTVKGKTSWEISQILGCTNSTVLYHIRNVITKLEVNNRAQAVGKVVGEAHIPPFFHLDGRPIKEKSASLIRIQSVSSD